MDWIKLIIFLLSVPSHLYVKQHQVFFHINLHVLAVLKNFMFFFSLSFFRHVIFLLQTMHDHLSDDEKKELCALLESSAKQCTGSPKETDNNRMDVLDMPMIPLARMPLVRYIVLGIFFIFV